MIALSGVISRVTLVISPIKGLVTLLITTHEPPSTATLRTTSRDPSSIGFLVPGSTVWCSRLWGLRWVEVLSAQALKVSSG